VSCSEKHTPLSPHKNRIRRNWMKKINKNKDIITISHGLLDVAMLLGWRGRIQICDLDPGVRETTTYLAGLDGYTSDYPELNILPPGTDIYSTVEAYCSKYGIKHLRAVDVDLACKLDRAWLILAPVLGELSRNNYKGKVFLTFQNGRDQFGKNATGSRINWFRQQVSKCAKLVRHDLYRSVRINQNAERSMGSAMCFVEFQMS